LVNSAGYSTQCVSTTNTSGAANCNSTNFPCVYSQWISQPILGNGPSESVTNTYNTTVSSGSCTNG
jgi:hypothetical protein